MASVCRAKYDWFTTGKLFDTKDICCVLRNMFSAREIIDIALKIEQNGEAVYRKAGNSLAKTELSERLAWMADEEARHREWFQKFQSDLQDDNHSLAVDEMSGSMLHDLVGEQSFTLQDIDFAHVTDLPNLIDIFIEFEKDGILFYEMLCSFIKKPDVLEHLDQIILEEYQHIDTLKALKTAPPEIE